MITTINKGTVILDRDGVINKNRYDYVKNLSEFEFISGSIAAIKLLHACGFRIVVASNQAGVAKGLIKLEDLSKIEAMINYHSCCELDFFYCTHLSTENCDCRKPKPGMLNSIRKKYTGPYLFIGDNITDFYAAQNANIDFCLVLTGHGLKARDKLKNSCEVYENLLECVKDFLVNSKKIYGRDID